MRCVNYRNKAVLSKNNPRGGQACLGELQALSHKGKADTFDYFKVKTFPLQTHHDQNQKACHLETPPSLSVPEGPVPRRETLGGQEQLTSRQQPCGQGFRWRARRGAETPHKAPDASQDRKTQ